MNLKSRERKTAWHELFHKKFVAVYIALSLVFIINQVVFSYVLRGREFAKAEGTPISCGMTIDTPGTYILSGNLDCTGLGTNGVIIDADNVTIDGRGYTIDGHIKDLYAADDDRDNAKNDFMPGYNEYDPSTWQWGVVVFNHNNVTIKNLHVANFFSGIGAGGDPSPVNNITIQNNTITNDVHYNLSFISPPGIALANVDSATITQNNVSNMGTGIYVDQSFNSNIANNTVTKNWSVGLRVGGGSSDNITIANNLIKSNYERGLAIQGGTDIVVQNNTIVFNRMAFYLDEPTRVITGNIFAHNIEDPMIAEYNPDIARGISLSDKVDFEFGLQDFAGNLCSTCTYSLDINPGLSLYDVIKVEDDGFGRPVVRGSFDATIAGTYSLQISVSDGSNTAYRNKMFYVDSVGSENTTYYFRANEDNHPRAGYNSTHGQPRGRDDGPFLLTPPTEYETEFCSRFVLNTVDELPDYPFGLVTEQNLSFWHKEVDSRRAGIRRFGGNGGGYDFSTSVATSPDADTYVWSSGEAVFSGLSNWAMDYPWSWYLLSFQYGRILFGEGDRFPYIQTRPEQPSANIITHIYPITPAVKSLSNSDIILLSANPNISNPNLGIIILDGTYASDHAVDVTLDSYNYPFRSALTRINADGTATLMAINVNSKTTFDSVNMAVAPDSGYVDIEITDWNTGAGYYKRWVETGDVGVSFVVADMAPNTNYDVLVDGSVYTNVDSDADGVITFRYGGIVSTHVFQVGKQILGGIYEQLPTTPADFSCQALSSDTIRWTFTDTSADEKGFRLYGPEGLIWSSGPEIVTDLNYIEETGLAPETLYEGRYVTTFAPVGESGPSNTASCRTLAAGVVSEPEAELPAGVNVGDLVKRADISVVYFIDNDYKRHTFPNEKTYYSWFADFSGIKTISATDLAAIPMGSNVTMRPGTYLVKIQTDPKVYAVEPSGFLRWISSELIAAALYGADWNARIADVEPTFFSDYQMGEPVTVNIHPTGSAFSYENDVKVYYMEQAKKRYISTASFLGNKFQDQFIIRNISALITYETGEDLPVMRIEDLMTLR